MIVDTHVHVWEIDPPKYPVGPTAPSWNSYPDEPGTVDELLAEMDAHGVDWTVLVQTSWSTWDNGYIADSVARFPDRFIGHGLIDPQDPNNAEQVRYWIQERGLVGFRFHPMYYPDEKILLTRQNGPMWEEIAALDAIIQFHLRAEFADQVAVIAQRYPHLKTHPRSHGVPTGGVLTRRRFDRSSNLPDTIMSTSNYRMLLDVRIKSFLTQTCIRLLRSYYRLSVRRRRCGGQATPVTTDKSTTGSL